MHPSTIETLITIALAGFAAAAPTPAPATEFDNGALVARDTPAGNIVARGNGHSKPKTYMCPYCSAKYSTAAAAKDCSKFCKAKRELAEADIEAREVSDDVFELVARGNGHSKPKTYMCPYCSAKYSTAAAAKDCSKFCKAKRDLATVEARELAEEASELAARGNIISKPKTYMCPYCSAKYSTAKAAKDCSKFCKAKRDLTKVVARELAEKASQLVARGNGHSKPKTYMCPYCSAKYSTAAAAKDCSKFCKAKRDLANVEARELAEEASQLVARGNGHSKPKTYMCPYCSAKYSTAAAAKDCSKFCKAKRSFAELEELD